MSPATASFSPDVIDIHANPMAYGATRTFTVNLGNVSGGTQVCFIISTHNADFGECCSIRRCVNVPRCYDGANPTSGTSLVNVGFDLAIDNPDGNPGCTFPLGPGTTVVDLHWRPIAPWADGAFIEQDVRGRVDGGTEGVLATARTTRRGEDVLLNTGFPALAPKTLRYDLFLEGNLVTSVPNVPVGQPAICNGCGGHVPSTDAHFSVLGFVPASEEGASGCSGGSLCLFDGYTFSGSSAFNIAGLVTANADEIRVFPEGAAGARVAPTAFDFSAHGISRVVFTQLDETRDCAIGDCSGATPDAFISLNTGFNQTTGALLPVGTLPNGTNDDDWKIVSPGTARPAKVVIAPVASWPVALPNSQWISADPNRGASPGDTQIAFERCFCLAPTAHDVTLALDLRADDDASVFLNGTRLASGGRFSLADPLHVSANGPFVTGLNCVRVEVHDTFGVFTGFDVDGFVAAPEGACP